MESDPNLAGTLAAAVGLALVHLLAGRLRFLDVLPRSRWLSFAGGVSVAYVFVHLLPELSETHHRAGDATFLLALAGLALFYGVEQHSAGSQPRAFELSMVSFAVYNALIGYLLVRGEHELLLFTIALGVHFVVNDFGLREHHQEAYHRVGRWLLAGAVLAGWGLAQVAELSETAVGFVIAFLGGGVILNVLKEELPGERRARFVPFLLGATAYAALLEAA